MCDCPEAKRILEGTVKVWEILAYLEADRYMDKHSAAAFIDRKDERTVEQAIRAGQLRAYRIGKKILVKKSDLEAWVQAHEVTPQVRQAEKNDLQKLVERAVKQARKGTE